MQIERGRFAVVLLIIAAFVGCGGPPRPVELDATAEHAQTDDGLVRVKARRFEAAWLRRDVSFAGYDAVLIDPVTVSYESPPRPQSSSMDRRGNFALSEESTARLKRIFQENFEDQLGRSDLFGVVTEAGPNVLRVSGRIVDLVVNVPRQTGSDRLFVTSAGEMTLALDVRDSLSGQALVRIADRREIRPGGTGISQTFESDPVNNWAAVRQITNGWASSLREALDGLLELSLETGEGETGPD